MLVVVLPAADPKQDAMIGSTFKTSRYTSIISLQHFIHGHCNPPQVHQPLHQSWPRKERDPGFWNGPNCYDSKSYYPTGSTNHSNIKTHFCTFLFVVGCYQNTCRNSTMCIPLLREKYSNSNMMLPLVRLFLMVHAHAHQLCTLRNFFAFSLPYEPQKPDVEQLWSSWPSAFAHFPWLAPLLPMAWCPAFNKIQFHTRLVCFPPFPSTFIPAFWDDFNNKTFFGATAKDQLIVVTYMPMQAGCLVQARH